MSTMATRDTTPMSPSELPLIVLDGSPRERGRQYGEMFRMRITGRVAQLREKLSSKWPSIALSAQVALQKTGEASEGLWQEVLGIADGASVAATDIFLLSAFEITGDVTVGCTVISLSDGGSAVMGQNWDAAPGTGDDIVVLLHRNQGQPELALIASIGGIGWVGANTHGLALCNADLVLKGACEALPSQVMRRLVLEQGSTADGSRVIHSRRHAGGRCYLIGDSKGDVRCLEVGPGSQVRTCATGPCIAHTNHSLHQDIAVDEDTAALERTYPTSRRRLSRAADLVRCATPTLGEAKRILADREGAPHSICKAASAIERTETTFSMIFETKTKTMHVGRTASALTHVISL